MVTSLVSSREQRKLDRRILDSDETLACAVLYCRALYAKVCMPVAPVLLQRVDRMPLQRLALVWMPPRNRCVVTTLVLRAAVNLS